MAQSMTDLKAEILFLEQLLLTMKEHPAHIAIKVIDPIKLTFDEIPLQDCTLHAENLQKAIINQMAHKITQLIVRYHGVKNELTQRQQQQSKLQVIYRNAPASNIPGEQAGI